jgi:predicted house-cleaning noncanonical NTP pyrophosphatase (MazG superfamily)
MKKLVRDRIPEQIKANGETPVTRVLDEEEFKKELLKKLAEEASEAAVADGKEKLIEELADIQEVMLALYNAFGIDCKDVTNCARKKRKERGSFTEKIFLEGVE